MSHVDLNVDNVNKLISWFYEKNISKRFDMKIIDAFYNELDENIHVYFGEMTRSRYMIFRIDGKLISDVDFLEKTYYFLCKKSTVSMDILSAIYDCYNDFLLLLLREGKDYYIKYIGVHDEDVIVVPHNIIPEYLIQMKEGATLVGDSDDVDEYGRYRWNYSIDYRQKAIERRCLAY